MTTSEPAQLVEAGGGSVMPQTLPMPKFEVVSNPEFLREGSAIFDTLNPERILLGGNRPEAIDVMKELYQPIVDHSYAED